MGHPFYRYPRLLLLSIALIVVAGLSGLSLLPRLEDPKLTPRFALVLTRYPGASAERIEALVTEPLEDSLRELAEIGEISSTSRAGISVIELEIRDEIDDVERVWSEVRDQLAETATTLPPGVLAPYLEDKELETYTLIAALVWRGEGEAPTSILARLSEELEDRFKAEAGTEHTNVYGAGDEEVLVTLDPARLAASGLSFEAVARSVRERDAKTPAGALRRSGHQLSLEVDGELTSLDAVRSIPIGFGAAGETFRLGDVATVTKGLREPRPELVLIDGRPAVVVAARMEPDRRVDLWSAAMRARLETFAATLPRGLEARVVFDQAIYTSNRLEHLSENLLLGAGLVLVMIFLLMGWKSALLVGAALPLASLMVLGLMRALDVPLHQMSVTGLIIALGLLIDNAIVIVDEVRHRVRAGHGVGAAVLASARHLAFPLLGSTLTTIFAFLPIVLMPGPAGEFVGTIGLTVILALISSFILALTVIPALTGLFSRDRNPSDRPSLLTGGLQISWLQRAWSWTLGYALRHPILVLAVSIALPAVGFVMGGTLREQFFPVSERDQFQVQMTLPPQTSIEATRALALEARNRMLAHPEVQAVHWFVGRSSPLFYYNMRAGKDDAAWFAQAIVQLGDGKKTTETIHELQRELDETFPRARWVAMQFEQGPPFDAPVEMRLHGPGLDPLLEIGDRLRAILASVPGIVHAQTTFEHGRSQLHFDLDEERANPLGLANAEVARRLDAALEGVTGGSILEGTEELPVRVRLGRDDRGSITAVTHLDLGRPDAPFVPLSALGRTRLEPEWSSITRRNGERCNSIQGFIRAGDLPSDVVQRFQAAIDQVGLTLPPGYRMALGGEASERDEAVGRLMAQVGLLLVLMAATLVLSFNSFRQAAIIGVVAGLSVGLGLAALFVFGHPFGFMAIVGTMGLIGIAVNDAIVVLAAINEDPAARAGDPDAIRRVVHRSSRHVIATTLTTMAGFTPLILGGGGFWPPLAVVIAGGLVGATQLALLTVPSLFLLLRCPRPVRGAARVADPEAPERSVSPVTAPGVA